MWRLQEQDPQPADPHGLHRDLFPVELGSDLGTAGVRTASVSTVVLDRLLDLRTEAGDELSAARSSACLSRAVRRAQDGSPDGNSWRAAPGCCGLLELARRDAPLDDRRAGRPRSPCSTAQPGSGGRQSLVRLEERTRAAPP